MKMEEFIRDEWVNISPHLFVCMSNMGDGLDWQIDLSLYADTENHKMLKGNVGILTPEGIVLNANSDYVFRVVLTTALNPPEYLISKKGFMIFAKRKENKRG